MTETGLAVALHHGGRLEAARRRFPLAPEPWIDLSTGINPVPFPFVSPPLSAYARLPEPEEEHALREAAARAYGAADPSMVVAAPGTQILINLLPRVWPAGDVAVLGPTYAEHAAAWAAAGSRVVEVSGLSAVPPEATCVVLCNPNNPDGRRTVVVDLARMADRLAARGGLLVVDEAFADFEGPTASVARLVPHAGVLALRSFGKSYGLAGLRLGFALASPRLADELRRALGPWAVSGPAVAIARQAFANPDWLAAASARLDRDAGMLDRMLMGAGLHILGGTRLFRLAQTDRAASLFDHMGRAGILVRQFHRNHEHLRFGIPGTIVHWKRIEDALSAHVTSRYEKA
jgi:cobalamin biosynthetic protein CobC